jgi:putative chitinase
MKVWPTRFKTREGALPYVKNAEKLAELVYQGRMENDVPGEAFLYRGRGLKQLTGEANYLAYSMEADNEALVKPDILLQPFYAADSAGWFWHRNHCNSFADKRNWKGLTLRINGGFTGLADRIARTERALKVLGGLRPPLLTGG